MLKGRHSAAKLPENLILHMIILLGKWKQNKFVFSANVYAKKERIFGNKIFSYCLFKLSCLTRIFTGLKFCELLFSSSVCVGRAM